MQSMLDQVLVILLSLMQCSVWTKTETPVSKLVLQKYVAGSQVTCNETCAGENLICNFQGINFVPLEELKARIVELLPDKICSNSREKTTLTMSSDPNFFYDSSKQLFAYNRLNECTSGYMFTPGGPIPLCSTLPSSQQLLICKCQSKRDYKLVAQSISSRISENCKDICSRQDMTCNFEGINLIPLEELKAQIIDLFPGSFCYDDDDRKIFFTLSVHKTYRVYKRGSVVYYNIGNHCTTRYIFSPKGPVPDCATLPEENGHLLICKCQIMKNAGQMTNKSVVPARGGTDTTVVPATPCSCTVPSTGILAVLVLGCGVALSCGGMLLCGLVWRERSRARRTGAEKLKSGEKGRRNMKWKKKTKKPFGIDDTKCSYDSKTSIAVSRKTIGSIKTPSTLRSKDKQSINSKTKESIKPKDEVKKSVVYTKVPESDYETVN